MNRGSFLWTVLGGISSLLGYKIGEATKGTDWIERMWFSVHFPGQPAPHRVFVGFMRAQRAKRRRWTGRTFRVRVAAPTSTTFERTRAIPEGDGHVHHLIEMALELKVLLPDVFDAFPADLPKDLHNLTATAGYLMGAWDMKYNDGISGA